VQRTRPSQGGGLHHEPYEAISQAHSTFFVFTYFIFLAKRRETRAQPCRGDAPLVGAPLTWCNTLDPTRNHTQRGVSRVFAREGVKMVEVEYGGHNIKKPKNQTRFNGSEQILLDFLAKIRSLAPQETHHTHSHYPDDTQTKDKWKAPPPPPQPPWQPQRPPPWAPRGTRTTTRSSNNDNTNKTAAKKTKKMLLFYVRCCRRCIVVGGGRGCARRDGRVQHPHGAAAKDAATFAQTPAQLEEKKAAPKKKAPKKKAAP
jgi:hypothetical protein